MDDQKLDCKDLQCPMPIIKISKIIESMEVGQRLIVEATDPAFRPDIEAWGRKTGHAILEFSDDDIKTAVIEKK